MENNYTHINEIFDFTNRILLYDQSAKEARIDRVCSFTNNYIKIYDKWKKQLPYHINIVDLLHADENAHTKMLLKLLQYPDNDKYPILSSFLNIIREKCSIPEVGSPKFQCNKESIDGVISEVGKYAIIIENKIHGAVDQNTQIERYIETVKAKGFNNDQIYVIYLTRDGYKEIQDYSLTDKAKETLGMHDDETGRFLTFNYRSHILPWLEQKVLPEIKLKEEHLVTTVKQYIDHLEGMFNIRKINNAMNMELQDYLKKEIGCTGDSESDFEAIQNKFNDVQKVLNQLGTLKGDTINQCFEIWRDNLKRDYSMYEIINGNQSQLGIKFTYQGKKFSILIEANSSSLYYGFGRHYCSEIIDDIIQKGACTKTLNEIGGFKSSPWWYGWKYTSYKNGYKRLKALIDLTIKELGE